jgi:transposase
MYYEKSKEKDVLDKNQIEFVCLDQLVPVDHLVRKIESAIDFNFIYDYTKDYYSENTGRPCLDTVTLFKIIILNFLVGKNSIRGILEETKVNMAYRWFLNLSLTGSVPNYSTFSQNYIRRYKDTDVFEKIFNKVFMTLLENEVVDLSVLFVDGTHIKASANKKKFIKKQVNVAFTKFEEQIQEEINEFRKETGRNEFDYFDDDDENGMMVDDETGEVKKIKEKKTINVSKVDPDSGMFVKGEHERQFAYVDQVACDKHGWIVCFDTNPGNMHDSKAFLPLFERQLLKFDPKVICGDAAFNNTSIARFVEENNIQLLVPYVAPRGGKDPFNKGFKYYLEANCYLCPNWKMLTYNNIDRDGYMHYQIERHECNGCPFIKQCLKKYHKKTIRRHLYADYMELNRNFRLSEEGKNIYKLRKTSIERVFAEAKENHGLRFTRFRGLKKNRHIRCLLYACLNIKKLALLLFRRANNQNKLITT